MSNEETNSQYKRVFERARAKEKTYIYEYRYDERLKTKVEKSTRLTYTGLHGGLEHLKIETRLRGKRVENVKGVSM